MRKLKKKYLSLYLLQEAKIERIRKMQRMNPELNEGYLKKLEECLKIREKIEAQISAVDDELLSELLFQKYVFGKTLEDISYILNYSPRHIERLHIKALDQFKMD